MKGRHRVGVVLAHWSCVWQCEAVVLEWLVLVVQRVESPALGDFVSIDQVNLVPCEVLSV